MRKILYAFMITAPLAAHIPDWSFSNDKQGRTCDFFTKMYFHYSETQRQWAFELIGKIRLKGDEKILDFGCGDGKITAQLSHLVPFGDVSGTDFSYKMIKFAQKKFPSNTYPNLGFNKNDSLLFYSSSEEPKYDIITAFTVFHLVDNPVEVLKNLKTHLKPDGKLLLLIPTGMNPTIYKAADEVFVKYGLTTPWIQSKTDKKHSMRTAEGCSRSLREAGYKIISMEIVETLNAFYDLEDLVMWMVGTVSPNWNIPAELGFSFFTDLVHKMHEMDPSMIDEEGTVLFTMPRIHLIAKPVNLTVDSKLSDFIGHFTKTLHSDGRISLNDGGEVSMGSWRESLPFRFFVPGRLFIG